MFGAWGDATADGNVLQLRALDWDTDGPFQDYPQVTIYHGDGGAGGQTFANVGWTGWLGSITGMSASALGISEIGVSFPDDSFGKESRLGVPFTFLLRDLLQWETTLDGARHRIASSKRTCDLILGVGDGKPAAAANGSAPFNSVQYSASVAAFMNDSTLRPVNATWHAPIPRVVYHGMDWLCPAFSSTLHRQLSSLRGSLTPEIAVSKVAPVVQTGDLHVAIYDLAPERLALYVANARGAAESGPLRAFDRQHVKIDLRAAFAFKPAASPSSALPLEAD